MLDSNSRSILFQSEKKSRDEWINENVTLVRSSQPVRVRHNNVVKNFNVLD